MDAGRRLREYIIKKYGEIEEPMGTQIKRFTAKELNVSNCQMCGEPIHMKKSFLYEPLMKSLTGAEDRIICETCAKREHGSKNRYKWKQLMEDLKNG